MLLKARYYILLAFLSVFFLSCSNEPLSHTTMFTLLDSEDSGIVFSNQLKFVQDFNIYTYRNFYNGGGVGIGDVNNDGLMDIYFTANMLSNKLYLNNGDLTFTDITDKAGVGGSGNWSTGVSMADVNGDGWTDIYVCNSGDIEGDNKQNKLYINKGDGTFTEEAEKYGLADRGYSTHAAFFDYDRDGDLDVYLLNNSFQAIGSFNLRKNERPIRNAEGGDKFFKNEDGVFRDVSEEVGIYGSIIGFGLGVTVGDINLDGWQDIYVSNDFFERDYIYMNNGDGTFTEDLENQMKSISGASMGADMADINNDGYPDIFVTEMLPEPNDRLKTKTTFENWDRYQYNIENGYYHQFTRNMLQLNNGDNTFSEIGRLSGVEATDWSWGALINDFDNDGLKDLFIANGIQKDLTDQDYINYFSNPEVKEAVVTKDGVDFQKLTDLIPSNKIPNYMYHNKGRFEFENITTAWGLDHPSHSNGSAYVDLDNDGDLDLVINNSNDQASIYVNNLLNGVRSNSHYLSIILKGKNKNTQAVGARIEAYCGESVFYYEQMPVKGFQSSVDPRPHLGLGGHNVIDTLILFWPDGSVSKKFDLDADQTITIVEDEENTELFNKYFKREKVIFHQANLSSVAFTHTENKFVDFDRDRLIYHMLSTEGPALCVADFNQDGLSDFYIGGASEQAGAMYFQLPSGEYRSVNISLFEEDKLSEDVDCTCFDADGDGDIDLYVASGGNEFSNSSSALIDRLYINNGKGIFKKSEQILPSFQFQNSSCVKPSDIDNDGDIDLFVGARARPSLIGVPADGFITINDGKGNFTDQTSNIAPELKNLGMITDASWSDIDNDGDEDLVVVGEWMRISIFENSNGLLMNVTDSWGLDSSDGWWNVIEPSDLDNDGDIDFVIGGHGLNSRFSASCEKPAEIFVNDFDNNGSAEAIITTYFGDRPYPLVLRHDLVMQLPILKKKYAEYKAFQDEDINSIFTPEQISKSIKSSAYLLESILLINENGRFVIKRLPVEAQLSPTYAIVIDDFDGDEIKDIVLGGNFYNAKPEVGRYDASYGTFLKGNGKNEFAFLPNKQTGLYLDGQTRAIKLINEKGKKSIIIGRNNNMMLLYNYD